MTQDRRQQVKNVCAVFLAFVSYSCPYWLHYFTNEVKHNFDYFDMYILTIQLISLLSTSVSQIFFSGFADSYGFLTVFTVSFVHCLIPIFIIDNAIRTYILIFAYAWFCFAVAIFFSAASKLYGTIFTGLPMKISFCFLAYTNNSAQALGNIIFFKTYYSFVDVPTVIYMSVPLLLITAILIYMALTKTNGDRSYFQNDVTLKQLFRSSTVYGLASSLMFLRFAKDFCFEALPPRIIRSSEMSTFFARFVSAITGLIGSLFITLFSVKPVDALLQLHFICAVLSLISSILIVNDQISGDVIVYLFGLFFDTPEAILCGYIAVQTGEALGNAGARVTGIINGIANFGRMFAVVALYNISKITHLSCFIFTASSSMFLITLLLAKYCYACRYRHEA